METMKRPNYVEELLEIFRSPLNKEELLDKISDYHENDIAEVLDVAVGTLKATYHNAVKKIEESLKISDTLPSFE